MNIWTFSETNSQLLQKSVNFRPNYFCRTWWYTTKAAHSFDDLPFTVREVNVFIFNIPGHFSGTQKHRLVFVFGSWRGRFRSFYSPLNRVHMDSLVLYFYICFFLCVVGKCARLRQQYLKYLTSCEKLFIRLFNIAISIFNRKGCSIF